MRRRANGQYTTIWGRLRVRSRKVYIRTLWANDARPLWGNYEQRENLRRYLNEQGFYVLTGAGDSLEVYALEYAEDIDIAIAKNILAKIKKVWYSKLTGG